MTKNTILVNMKVTMLGTLLPMLMVACNDNNKADIDSQLQDIDAQTTVVDAKLDSMLIKSDEQAADSLKRDPVITQLSQDIAKYQKSMARFTAPKDSTTRKKFSRKLGHLRMDSLLQVNRVKEAVLKLHSNELNAIYKEQASLKNKRDSLMKIKTR